MFILQETSLCGETADVQLTISFELPPRSEVACFQCITAAVQKCLVFLPEPLLNTAQKVCSLCLIIQQKVMVDFISIMQFMLYSFKGLKTLKLQVCVLRGLRCFVQTIGNIKCNVRLLTICVLATVCSGFLLFRDHLNNISMVKIQFID